ncbi:ATP-binding protein [Pseudoalteromonas fenneropenaei]|uniref:histidine kinase n=1 Tax=Pseudoalteromonas fenneropenaei TaxID=1737459 RepID=A0ABV7CQG0_9GAMM
MTDKFAPLQFFKTHHDTDLKVVSETPWKVLIVDDDEQVHLLSKMVLGSYAYKGRKLKLLHANSGTEAFNKVAKMPDIALILLDVIMETSDAGLKCVQRIREELGNDVVRIILRTGQPGEVPEFDVMQHYDINDYKCKTELTKDKLFSTITGALRTYEHVAQLKQVSNELASLNTNLEHKVAERTQALQTSNEELQAAKMKIELQQNALVQAEKMASLGQLAAGVAHEINNPLGFILSNLEFLQEYRSKVQQVWQQLESAEVNSQEEYLNTLHALEEKYQLHYVFADSEDLLADIHSGVRRIQAIVKDLSVFATQGGAPKQNIDLNTQVIQPAIEKLAPQLHQQSQLINHLEDLPSLRGVPEQLTQAFYNILCNANDALGQKPGEIHVSSAIDGSDTIQITIKDNGKGIEAKNLYRIFDPFFTTKPIGAGTGLGLSIALGIIKSHAGSVNITSDVSHGTEVKISFPRMC